MNKFLKPAVLSGLLTLILLTTFTSFGQKNGEVLTNAKIIDMVKLGLSETIIVEKIRQSECRCDTSTSALAELKTAKVSDAIILTMMNSSPAAIGGGTVANSVQNNSPEDAEQSKILSQLTEPGIYLLEGGEMKNIEPSVFSGSKMSFLGSAMTYGIKKSKYRAKVRGKSANLQTFNGQPTFYFVFNPDYKNSGAVMAGNMFWGMPATSPAEFLLVQMDVKDKSREAVMGEIGTWTGVEMGARDKDVREYAFEKVKPGIYKVIPKAVLTPGEYCFYYAGNVTGIGFAGNKIFDFGIPVRRL
jgi:hypothetical protein